jgi:pyruvate dehydrogenase E2 component (dihydrolipoamide acetyltransferase)
VPVIRDVSNLDVRQIAEKSRRLIELARKGELPAADMRGGTFTITNLGAFGIDAFTPIINAPECAILGIGRIVKQPVVMDDQFYVRDIMTLSLTFDHRIVDGAPAARFLQTLVRLIENRAELSD